MPRSNGIYSLPPVYLATPGTTVRSEQHNAPLEDIANALTGSVARDGSTPMQANLQMGGRKITGLGAPTAAGDAVTKAYADSISPSETEISMTGPGFIGKGTSGAGKSLRITFGDGLHLVGGGLAVLLGSGLSFVSGAVVAAVSRFASSAETVAGSITNAAVHPAGLRSAFDARSEVGAVGSVAMLRDDGVVGTIAPGTTRPGSDLRYSNSSGTVDGPVPSGIWRLLGVVTSATNESRTSLWVRVS